MTDGCHETCLISKNYGLKSHTWYLTLNSKRIHASEQTIHKEIRQNAV